MKKLLLIFLLLFTLPLIAKEPARSKPAVAANVPDPNSVDLQVVSRIRNEAFHNSKVMETMSSLTDSIGPRLTNSPNARKANAWTRDQLTRFGLENAHLEPWGPFGRGWSYEVSTVRMISPDTAELLALPKAWTPGTNGPVRGKVQRVRLETKEDLDKYHGKLAGAILLLGEMREVKPHSEPQMSRYTEATLAEESQYQLAPPSMPNPNFPRTPAAFQARAEFTRALNRFLEDEKVAATIEPTRLPGDGGTIFVQSGGSYKKDGPLGAPALVMDIEHYGRISRLLDRKEDVELEVNVKANFYDDDEFGYNTIAEIPGTDLKDQVVMLGAHLDSWHGGTGATDNGAGSAVCMEAVRIIKALDLHPRRTIRIALWTGEEQGLLGSRGYVKEHLGSRPESTDPADKDVPMFLRKPAGPLTLKPEQAKISGYFNLDNGSGRVRGVYLQENAALAPIFEKWMEPFHDLGMTALTMRNTGGTDHLSFDAVGVPGFQFIQDEIEYSTRTHHSNMDVYERLQPDDLKQASAIMASFVYNTAMRDEMLPRKALAKADLRPKGSPDVDAGKGMPKKK